MAWGPLQGAHADIQISPLRQVLTAKAPEARFQVSNPSERILDGRVSWVDLTATETGYEPANKDARNRFSAAPYLVVSPAQFRLEPGARITVVVKLKDGVTPPPGERRSHLLFQTGAARNPIRKAGNDGLQADLSVGVSAPVLLRSAGRAEASIGETALLRDSRGMLSLSTAIIPAGEISTYGRLTAQFAPESGGDPSRLLGLRDNVAGFVDAGARRVEIPFGLFSLGPGELTLRYEGAQEFEGRLFDQRVFDIQPAQ
jgi:hypothetical protein